MTIRISIKIKNAKIIVTAYFYSALELAERNLLLYFKIENKSTKITNEEGGFFFYAIQLPYLILEYLFYLASQIFRKSWIFLVYISHRIYRGLVVYVVFITHKIYYFLKFYIYDLEAHYLQIFSTIFFDEMSVQYLSLINGLKDSHSIFNVAHIKNMPYYQKRAWLSYFCQNNPKYAIKLIDSLIVDNAFEINRNRNEAVQLFLKQKYNLAERLWAGIEKYRDSEIKKRGLDVIGVRFLSPHWFLAIGHVAHLDSYFKNLKLNKNSVTKFIPPVSNQNNVNQYLLKLWDKNYFGENRDVIKNLNLSNFEQLLLQDDFWTNTYTSQNDVRMFNISSAAIQKKWKSENRKPILSLPDEDKEIGWKILNDQYQINRNQWFVCLHVRESGFHKSWHEKNPGTRNANINSYTLAVQEILNEGGVVIRLGDSTMQPILTMPGYFDYAHSSFKSDFMDIFLCAECKFFIGTNSGLSLVPPVFGKICALTNWSPIAIPQWYPDDFFIPKLIKDSQENYLNFKTLFSSEAGWAQFDAFFKENNLTVVDNTDDEILGLVQEVLDIVEKTYIQTEEDVSLNAKFSTLRANYLDYEGSIIGSKFLKKYRNLLD